MIKTKFFGRSFLMITTSFVIISIAACYIVKGPVYNSFQEEIKWAIDITEASLEMNNLKSAVSIIGENFYETTEVNSLKSGLENLGDLFYHHGVDAIYLTVKKDDAIYFIVESTRFGDNGYVIPGSVYKKAPEELKQVFATYKEVVTDIYEDEYGTYFSKFSPVMENGELVAVIGADIEYGYYTKTLFRARLFSIGIVFLLYVFFLLILFYNKKKKDVDSDSKNKDVKIKAIIDSVPSGIIAFDNKESIIFWNHACNNLFGFKSDYAIGKKIKELISYDNAINPETGKKLNNFNFFSDNSKAIKKIEFKMSKNDDILSIEAIFNFFEIGGEPMAIGLFNDISDRKMKENKLKEQKEKLEHLNSFMSDREEKMVELKTEINKLKQKLEEK